MLQLVLGLLIFLGVHSVRVVAEDWRQKTRTRVGESTWKAAYASLSVLGFVLIVWGFGLVRQAPVVLWSPPTGLRHLASLLTLLAFVCLAAAYWPGNKIKAWVHHPMTVSVKLWAFAHLVSNGNVGHVLLFGAFLIWAVLVYRAARQRDRTAGTLYPAGTLGATLATVAIGTAAWLVFAFWLHGLLIGVRPFG